MPIELAGIRLSRVHKITTLEQAALVSHQIPGLAGKVVQDMGRDSVRLRVDGIFYGATANDDLEALRDVYKKREPVDFLAEIVGQAYFAQVIMERFEVFQIAQEPDQFSYSMTIAEYVIPPEPASPQIAAVDATILDEALAFMDLVQLPDLLSVPNFGDPTVPLNSILDGVKGTLAPLTDSAHALQELFGEG